MARHAWCRVTLLEIMHEAAISEALLDKLASLAGLNGWSRIVRVKVQLGLLSGVVPEALEFAFEALAEGTPAEGAVLEMVTERAQFSCAACGDLDLDRLDFTCPNCGGPLRLLQAGRAILLWEVEPIISKTPNSPHHVR
jgi:hydrogenase nickel incorporation protein HypA/HybF